MVQQLTQLYQRQLASHSHPNNWNVYGGQPGRNAPRGQGNPPSGPQIVGSTGSGGGHSHNMSANFVGDATSVLQPYLTVIYIIKT